MVTGTFFCALQNSRAPYLCARYLCLSPLLEGNRTRAELTKIPRKLAHLIMFLAITYHNSVLFACCLRFSVTFHLDNWPEGTNSDGIFWQSNPSYLRSAILNFLPQWQEETFPQCHTNVHKKHTFQLSRWQF